MAVGGDIDLTPLDHFYEALGILGGILLAVCILPQLLHMYITKNAEDMQKRFLVLNVLGCIFTFVYLYVEDAWAAWITMVVEVSFKVF
jgi:uncharacterized protein with PQ loop repeat